MNGREEELRFKLIPRRRKRKGPKAVTDLDFADDIALLVGEIGPAQTLLDGVEAAAARVRLMANARKTNVMSFN